MNKRPIIIDTGPGINDAFATATASFSDELDVRLILTITGSVGLDKVTYDALRLLKYSGREDVPVAVGTDRPLICEFENANSVHGKSDTEGLDFEEPTQQPLKENAVGVMRNVITNSSEPVALVPTALLINIALLLKTRLEVRRNIREIVLMGNSVSRGDKGVMAELSAALDSEAAHIVFHSGVKLTMVGLDVGLKVLISPKDSEEVYTMNKTGEVAYCLFRKYRGGSFRTGLKMYDAVAVACLLRPELFEAMETYLDIESHSMMTAGYTLVDLRGYLGKESNATVYPDVNGNAFRTWSKETTAKHRQNV